MLKSSRVAFHLNLAITLLALLLTSPLALSQATGRKSRPQKDHASQTLSDMGPLKFNSYEKRILKSNETHLYHGTFAANYYLQVRADFLTFDGVLRLFAPNGTKLGEIDLPRSTEARKELWLVTPESGNYSVEIEARNAGASGAYNVMLHSSIPNDEKNQKLITATRSQAEGWRLHEIWTQESLHDAIPIFETAISLWRELGNNWNHYECVMYLGEVYHRLSNYRKAIEVYETLLPIINGQLDPAKTDATWTYNNLASSHNALGEKAKAREYYKLSLAATLNRAKLLEETNGPPLAPGVFGLALMGIGNFSIQVGEKQEALDYLYQSLPYLKHGRQDNPEVYRLARAYRGLSEVYASLGHIKLALSYANEALTYSRRGADVAGEIDGLNILGAIHSADLNYTQAIHHFNSALGLARLSGDRNSQAKAFANLGFLYLNTRSFDEAGDSFNKALLLFREIENGVGEAHTLTGLGMIARRQGDPNRALQFYSQALPLRDHAMDREGEAETLYEMARAHLDLGQLEAARSEIEKAIQQIEFVRRRFSGADLRAAYRSTVQRYYELYVRLLMLLHNRNPHERLDVLAFEQSEHSRARSLLDSLREAGLNLREGVDPELLRRERELQQLLNDKGTRHLPAGSEFTLPQKLQAESEIRDLKEELGRVQSKIRAANPRLAALTQAQSYTLQEIQDQVLENDTVLLEYEIGEEESFLWAVTVNSIHSYQLPKRAEIERLARHVYTAVSSRTTNTGFTRHAKELSRVLLHPVTRLIAGKRLIIVGNGILQYIPFSALPDPGNEAFATQPLIVDHEVVTLPSASSLALLRTYRLGLSKAERTLAVLADPVFSFGDPRLSRRASAIPRREGNRSLSDISFELFRTGLGVGAKGNIPRLPSTRREALAISRSVPAAQRMIALDFEANRSKVLSGELGQYRIVHFATHGWLDTDRPELSGLILSLVDQAGNRVNGFLQAHEIYGLKLPVDLVVLSACRSALGKDVKGEGLVGITRGFMYAGAPRIVSSLWEVDSRATAELMTRFYREMLSHKLAPAAALRAAQVSMWRDKRWHLPNHWAGFVIQGEYR